MTHPIHDRSSSELVSDAIAQLKALFRNEVELAKAEAAQKASQAAVALGMLAAALGFSIATLVMILFTLASFLTDAGLSAGASSLIATLIGAAAAAGLAWVGLQRLKGKALIPERAVRQLQRDAAATRGEVR